MENPMAMRMNLKEFLANPEWDTPFFKVLAHNDTGAAVGKMAGMVVPKELRDFFPALDEGATSSVFPTIDRRLKVEMFVGASHLIDSAVRYQLQTWRGTRRAEIRITDGLRPLRDKAKGGDIMLFQRRADALDRFRLILVKNRTEEFNEASQWIRGRRWGSLFESNDPVTQIQLNRAEAEIIRITELPFQLTRSEVPRNESRQSRIARTSVFRERIRREYKKRCAVSGIVVVTPDLLHEVEAAHIIPLPHGGVDDVRNGFTLTQTLHWAFDRGLFGVQPDRKVFLPRRVKAMAENGFLKQFDGRKILEAATEKMRAHPDAFRWHMDKLVRQWD